MNIKAMLRNVLNSLVDGDHAAARDTFGKCATAKMTDIVAKINDTKEPDQKK